MPVIGLAEEFEYEGLLFNVLSGEEKTVEVKGYTEIGDTLHIPEEIQCEGVIYTVVQIGEKAFNNINVNKIIFPSTILYIDREAFKEARIRNSNLELPENLVSIASLAFYNSIFGNVIIPSSLIDISLDSFLLASFDNFIVNPENLKYSSVDGLLYDKDIKELIIAPRNKEKAVIPEGVKVIGPRAFYRSRIKEIQFPETLLKIESYAFYETQLENVIFPQELFFIGLEAFSHSRLETITFLDSNFIVDEMSFYGTTTVQKVIIYGNTIPKIKDQGILKPIFEDSREAVLYVEEALIPEYISNWRWRDGFKEILPLSMASATSLSEAENEIYKVYDLRGINILNTKDKSEISNLPSGLYIINGKKVRL